MLRHLAALSRAGHTVDRVAGEDLELLVELEDLLCVSLVDRDRGSLTCDGQALLPSADATLAGAVALFDLADELSDR